ncbi:carbohydrate ABC transporter permease [Paenibacillus sp. PAMC21692]|uniref:carbohydrate ABC transporter permease n=1 Tax=Paenibacillus sp. PAMC21692 TaxID=2762320 RepID=UPI00164E724A|nr:carbohydrate ABC transporter permease [Paenibacillus sp. PAMC21692]QNK57902.1 carbohydrate ABC transporter permease [Paenibacillus sp. PAMC21692]
MFARESKSDILFNIIVTAIALVALLVTFYPLYFITIASISSPEDILSAKVIFKPSGVDFSAYQFIFEDERIWKGYANTILYTVCGTLFGVGVTTLAGYALSRQDLAGRGWLMKVMVFTMFFNGGLIPTYMVVKELNLLNTPFVLMILGSVWVYNIIISKTFFEQTIPKELLEAAFIDGCGNFRFFMSVVLPVSKSVIAVIALFYAVGHWNSYFNALIYVTERKLYPLQLILRDILVQGQTLPAPSDASELEALAEKQRIAEVIKYGVVIVSSLPLLVIYPFLQRFFVKGVMIGSVKG